MSRLVTAFLLLMVLVPDVARSEAFAAGTLFIGRSVKPEGGAWTFKAGLKAGGAPLSLAIGSIRDRMIDEAVNKACGNNETCKTETRQAVDRLSSLSDAEWARLEQDAGDKAALDKALDDLVRSGQITATDKQRIEDFVSENATTAEERRQTLALARWVSEVRANILLSPYVQINLEPLSVMAELPLVLTLYENRTDVGLANFNTDVRFGHHLDVGVATLGLSYGLHVYFPTGAAAADPAAYAFLFHSPRYLHSYLSLAPYVVGGVEFPFVTVQTYGEIVSMHKVRSGKGVSNLQFFQYGLGLTLFPDFFVSVVGELNGLVPINNARSFNALFALGGLRFQFFIIEAGVGVQAPIYSQSISHNLPAIQGFQPERLAELSVLAHVGFGF